MFARALIVLLLVLNLGVALWWATRGGVVSVAPEADTLAGVPRLQLLNQAPASPKAAADTAATPVAQPPATAVVANETASPASEATPPTPHCYALGPFDEATKAQAVRTALQSRTSRANLRQAPASRGSGWRVWIPPQSDRAAAQALAARLNAAGFSDLFILSAGSDANGIALGRYGNETAARQHEAALRAAGFVDARAEALGKPAFWLDVAAPAGVAAVDLRKWTGATSANAIDCPSAP